MFYLLISLLIAPTFAAMDPNMPRAGLYKIMKMEATMTNADNKVKHNIDSATGDVTVTYEDKGKTVTKKYPGEGSQRQCIKYNPNGVMEIPWKGACVGKPAVRVGDASVSKAECDGMSVVVTMKKLENDVYQQTTKVEMKTGSNGMPVMGLPDQKMMEAMIAAQPPGKRAEMKKQLAAMYSPEARAKMDAQMKMITEMQARQEIEMEKELASAKTPEEKAAVSEAIAKMKESRTPGRTYQTHDASYILVRIGDCR